MADLLHAPSGKVVTIPDEDVPQAYLTGDYALPQGPIAAQSPDGKAMFFDKPEDAAEAFKQGFKYMGPQAVQSYKDQQKFGEGAANAAKAAIGGFASAATFGLSDLAARKLNPEFANEDAKVRGLNPGSSMVGSVLGGAAPILATGGLGAAGEAAEGASLGAKALQVGSRVAQDAAFGGAFGAGQAISEASLGDHELTAEHLLSKMGTGALLGGGTGLALWGAGEALSPVLEKAQGAITDLRDAMASKAADLDPATSVRGLADTWNNVFDGVGGISKEMRDFNGPGEGIREREAQSMLAETPADPIRQDLATRLDEAQSTLEAMAAQPKKYSTNMIDKAQAVLTDMADDASKAPDAYGLRVAARDGLKALGNRASFGKNIADANSADTAAEIQGIWKGLRDHITNPDLYGAQAGRESAIREAESALVNKSWGSKDSELVANWKAIFGQAREKGLTADPGKIQTWAKQVASGNPAADLKTQVMQDMQAAVQKYTDTTAESAANVPGDIDLSNYQTLANNQAKVMGEIQPASAQAASAQKEGLLDLAAQGANRIPVVGPAIGKFLENPGKSLEVLSKFAELSQSATSSLQGGIRSFLRGTGPTGGAALSGDILNNSRFAYGTRGENALAKRTAEIDQYAGNPDALNQRLSDALGPLQQHAPNITDQIAQKTSGDYQYLQPLIPRDPSAQFSVGPSNKAFNASHPQRRVLAGAIQGVTDPIGSLRQMLATGMVNKASLDAIRARRPKIYDQFQAETMSAMSKSKRPLGYSQKLTLSRLTGAPLSISMTPAGVASLQASFSGAAPGGQAGATPKISSAAINKMDLAKGLQPREAHLGKGK